MKGTFLDLQQYVYNYAQKCYLYTVVSFELKRGCYAIENVCIAYLKLNMHHYGHII